MSSLGSATGPRERSAPTRSRSDHQNLGERILRFWRDVEIFNLPVAPSARDQSESLRLSFLIKGDPLPWSSPESILTPKVGYAWVHSVFIGIADASVLMRTVLSAAIPRASGMMDEELETTTGKAWLAAFSVDEQGYPVSESYVPTSFTIGVERLRAGKSVDGIAESLAKAQEEFKLRWSGRGTAESQVPALGWKDLTKELEIASARLGPSAESVNFRVLVKSVRRKQRLEPRDSSESDVDFLNSFFIEDLDRVIAQVGRGLALGAAITEYVADETALRTRTDVLSDLGAMARLTSARRLLPGRWPSPSKHHLSLGQQAAVMETLGRLAQPSQNRDPFRGKRLVRR